MTYTDRALTSYKIIAIVLIIIVVSAAALWWLYPRGSGNLTTTTTTTSKLSYNQLTIGIVASNIVLDPAIADDYVSWEILSRIMEGLVKIDPQTGSIEPGLAEKWTTPDNGRTWIFVLRKSVKFSDGTPLSADQVVRSIERVMIIRGTYSWLVTEFIYQVKALNDTAVMIKLKKPIQDFPTMVSLPIYFIVHPNYPLENPVPGATYGGIGPYKIESVTSNEIVLVRNEEYYGDKPGTKRLVFKIYGSSSELRQALEKGEIDIAWWGLSIKDAQELSSKGYKLIASERTAIKILALKVSGSRPTHILEIRKGIAYAIDQQVLAKIYPGELDQPAYSVVPSVYLGHVDAFKTYAGEDADEAVKLFNRAGYGETNLLRLTIVISTKTFGPEDLGLAKKLKEEIEATGIAYVEIKDLPHDAFFGAIISGDYDIALITLYPIYPDPTYYMLLSMYSKANRHIGIGYSNPQVDNQIERALATVDYSLRSTIYENLQSQFLVSDVPLVPLIEFPTVAVARQGIQGVGLLPNMLLATP